MVDTVPNGRNWVRARRKSILYISSNLLSRRSADVIYLVEMCHAFCKTGHDATLCVPNFDLSDEALFKYYGVEHAFKIVRTRFPKIIQRISGRGIIHSLLALKELVQMNDDVIVCSRSQLFFFINSLVFKRPCVYDSHSFRFDGPIQTRLYRSLVKHGATSPASFIACISESLREKWQAYGIKESKLFVLHDAVDVRKFKSSVSKKEARSQLGFDPEIKLVGYTGSLLPGKGVETLVGAANELPEFHFLIVGGVDEQIRELRCLARYGNVSFVGHVEPSKIPVYQAASDILALPNTWGSSIDDVTSPMKLFEYMASARPIVATDMPSLLEILKHGENALISPAGHSPKLAHNIRVLMNDERLASLLSQNALKEVAKYTWDGRAEKLLRIFNVN